jgi:hypothetical protein
MAKVLSKTGIITGEQVDAWHVTQSIDAFTKVEAYDITVSGSFTLTGSLRLSGSLIGNTTGTSSLSISSSHSTFSLTSSYALTSSFNKSDIYTLQFNHPLTDLADGSAYFMGMGSDLLSQYAGITVPLDSHILDIYVTVTNINTGSSETVGISLESNSAGTLWANSSDLTYNKLLMNISESIGLNVNKGDDLYFRIVTPNWGSKPFRTTHNIILTLLPYHL